MKCLQQIRFLKRFPGPYAYSRGVDGVDETFDTHCVTTGNHLISTYFWEAEKLREEVSVIVTAALNRQADWHGFIPSSFPQHWKSFRRRYPGPFAIGRDCCPGRGDFLDVYCTKSGESIIQSYGLDTESKLIANQIVAALNSLREATLEPYG
ncbi:MAG: hypothetical protein AB8G99_05270 [Planctomycetaceae bacterium]